MKFSATPANEWLIRLVYESKNYVELEEGLKILNKKFLRCIFFYTGKGKLF